MGKNVFDQFDNSGASDKPEEGVKNPFDQFDDPYTAVHLQGVSAGAYKNEVSFFDEGVDYTSGVPSWGLRADLSRMDNDEERAKYLTEKVGENNWDRDSSGRYLLWKEGLESLGLPGDMPTVIDETTFSKYDLADFRGELPAVLGAVGGGIASTGVGALPGIGLVALGAMGAKGYDEAADAARGQNLQSPDDVAGDLLGVGVESAVGEGLFRGARSGMRYAMAPGMTRAPSGGFAERMKKRLLDAPVEPRQKVPPKRQELTENALEMGAVPSIYQASERSLTGRAQSMIETVFGPNSYRTAGNVEAIINRAEELSAKVPGPSGGGRPAKVVLQRKVANARDSADAALQNVEKQAKVNIAKARLAVAKNGPEADEAIIAAKKTFDDQMNKAYGSIDNLVGGAEIVSSAPIKNMAREILKGFPKTKDGGRAFISPETRKQLSEIINLADNMTFGQAQRARTMLREAAENPNILNNISTRDLTRLKMSVDEALDPSADFMTTGQKLVIDARGLPRLETIGIPHEAGTEAARLLKLTGERYRDGIMLFDDDLVRRIARDPSLAGSIGPAKVAETVARSEPSVIQNLKKVVGDDSWGKILDNHLEGLYNDASQTNGSLNAVSMLNKIRTMGPRFNAMYGAQAKEVRELVREAAAKNADINLEGLNKASDMTIALKEAVARRNTLDQMLGDNAQFIKKVESGSLTSDQVADFAFRSGKAQNPELLRSVKTTLGESSPQWQAIQKRAMGNLLKRMEKESDDAVNTLLNGAGLDDAITAYGRDNLNVMFGRDLAGELVDFAKTVKFLTSRNTLSGGIVAANIALHPVKNIGKLAWMNVLGRIFNSKGAIKYFTEGLKAPKTRAGADSMSRAVSQFIAIGEESESPDEPNALPN